MKCNLSEHVDYKYTDCNDETNTQNVHFFYPRHLNCDPARQEDDQGDIVKEGSMELPPYYPGAKCDHLCPDDGYYSHMALYPEIK